MYGRLVALKAGPQLQLLLKYQHRDVTKNVPLGPALAAAWGVGAAGSSRSPRSPQASASAENDLSPVLRSLLGPAAFRRARLFTSARDLELKLKASGAGKVATLKPSLTRPPTTAPATPTALAPSGAGTTSEAATPMLQRHDRTKVVPVPPASLFLQRLGVTKPDGVEQQRKGKPPPLVLRSVLRARE